MVWPPDPLPNNRSNITPQLDNHPSDHNDIANTLADDFVEQISENIAAILVNAGAISGNTGGIAANLASINAQLVNFIPGADPIVRGNGALFQTAAAAPIGTGRLQSIVVQRGQGTGPTINLPAAPGVVVPGTPVTVAASASGLPATHCIFMVVDIAGGGNQASFAQGILFIQGAAQAPTAVFNYSSPDTGRGTVGMNFVSVSAGALTFDCRVSANGFLGVCDPNHTSLLVISIYP